MDEARPAPSVEPAPIAEPLPPVESPPIAEQTPPVGTAPYVLPAPPAAPVAPVWPRVGPVLSGSFDLVTQARIPLRNASLYIGALGVLTMGLSVLTLLTPGVDWTTDPPTGLSDWAGLAWFISALLFVAVWVESEIIGVAILGGARAGRPLTLREALRRSRQVFWRVLPATFAVGIVGLIVSGLIQVVFDEVFGDATDAAPVGATLLAGVITAPFIYVPVGIVLGDVGAVESIRRSIRLARARFRLAVVASVFSVTAQFILLLAASAGLELVATALRPFGPELETVDTADAGGFLLVAIGVLIAIFAGWSLSFTVSALTSGPQVVAFLGLTGYSSGLDGARAAAPGEPRRPAPVWMTTPMLIGATLAAISAILAIGSAVT